jgi:alkanesulfonate monooxygenase SsuD/methylene tetrahydromethanopterin reductase-like flavin-dependent oxidoreductase (luciferase family)
MQIDVGLDAVGVPFDEEAGIAVDAARLGYSRIWTGSVADPFQVCALRWAATRSAVSGGVGTAIGVLPVGIRTPADLAQSAAALSRATEGRFILGIGAGSTHEAGYRETWGIAERSPLALVRAYLTTIRRFLAGESLTYRAHGLNYHNARLPVQSPTPLYLGAVGPEMARLGGELADGVYLSWCTPDDVGWARARIAEGADRAQRDPAGVQLAASVRVCIDDDVQLARRAVAEALLPYVLGWSGSPPRPFRKGFERMGFGADLADIDRLHQKGSDRQDLIEAFPDRMLGALSYFGRSAGAADAIQRQVSGADVAVVRLVPSRPGPESVRAILGACRPGRPQPAEATVASDDSRHSTARPPNPT